jgi:ribonuclease P protein component
MSISSFTPQEVKKLFATARRVLRNPSLDILRAPKRLPKARILVITARRVGTAPQRNKIRRRLKSIFYEQGMVDGLYDCIVFIKPEGVNSSFEELTQFLLQAMQIKESA